METTDTQVQEAPLHYNANQLVTYKVIENGTVSYPTDKVNEIEWKLEQARRSSDRANGLQSKINQIIDNMTEDYWYNPNTEAETILNDLCEILEYTPVKNIDFTASLTIRGSIEMPITDAIDFDLDSYVFENLSIDTQTGTMDIHDFDVDRVDEC